MKYPAYSDGGSENFTPNFAGIGIKIWYYLYLIPILKIPILGIFGIGVGIWYK